MKRFILLLSLLFAAAAAWPNGAAGRITQARSMPRGGQPENRWRYVWHNDRWWYWTVQSRWTYFNGRRWVQYDPRRPSIGALAAGYRRAPAFEKPPAASPRPPMTWPTDAVESRPGLVDLFDLGRSQGGATSGGLSLPTLGGTGPTGARTGLGDMGGASGRIGGTGGTVGAGRTGGGGFGGPTGGSLGAGSAAGGASTPQ